MKKFFKSIIVFCMLLLLAFPVMITNNSCDEETMAMLDSLLTAENVSLLASYLFDNEKLDNIPEDIDIDVNDNTNGLPNVVDLTPKFPPIGNQGQYGTCVAWAAGYNLKTALNGIEKGYSATQLADKANQTSPKDLFWAIPSSKKGADCNGTCFEAALDAMIERGAATLDVVPYGSMGNCSSTPLQNWTTDAADNKLGNYRKIADLSDATSMTVDNFKAYLAEGRPIVFGAKLGDRFMQWNNDAVINYDTYNNPGMQHAYHALILAGYDEGRDAFRVINSWGDTWGDKGMIWVDYNFFLKSFCYAAFVAQNKTSTSITNHVVGSGDILKGTDLLAYNLQDIDDDSASNPLDRQILYNVFNSGTTEIKASQRWSILYLYYNAFNADDYGILIHDYYTDEFGPEFEDGNWDNGLGISASYWNNYNVPSGVSVADAQYEGSGNQFVFSYTMPNTLNGKYYLVLYADGLEKIKEENEDNNLFFFSRSDGKPFEYKNGVLQNPESLKSTTTMFKAPTKQSTNVSETLVKPGNLNTYSPLEIYQKLHKDQKSGQLLEKVKAFDRLKSTSKSTKGRAKY